MADTINDLYLKYVNSVGSTLEDDRYFRYLFEIVQAGANTLRQNHQVLHKVVDERWLTTIEESLDALNRITEHPRRFITSTEELVPVELARRQRRSKSAAAYSPGSENQPGCTGQ